MSPSSSSAAIPSHVHSRKSSNATPNQDQPIKPSKLNLKSKPSSRPNSPSLATPTTSANSKPIPHYTVFIRLPFVRNDVQDPEPVNWDATKDRQLWKLISKGTGGDLNWEGLSQEFGVELGFLLMQAAWLSERHMERMRRQVGRISTVGEGLGSGSGSAVGSGVGAGGGSTAVGGLKMERGGSRESRLPHSLITTTARRGSPAYPSPAEIGGSPGTGTPKSGHPPISRTPSTATVTQSKIAASPSKQPQPLQRALRGSSGSGRRPLPAVISSSKDEYYEDAIAHEGPSDSESEEEPSTMARSQAFRRPPIAKKAKPSLGPLGSDGDEEEAGDDDDDDDDSPGGYLPFAAASKPGKVDPAATLRNPKKATQDAPVASSSHRPPTRPKDPIRTATTTTESSASSASSAMQRQLSPDSSDNPHSTTRRHSHDSSRGETGRNPGPRPPGPISPRHRAHLASLSPRVRKEGSEGSPSMGSSFSDLDDASLSQSALEEALMSNVRAHGGSLTMASRMSSLRDAWGRRAGGGNNGQG